MHQVIENQDFLHKISITSSSSTGKRIAKVKLDATFLMAGVDIVAKYELLNINRVKLENLLHQIFERLHLAIEIADCFGNPVKPRDCFLVFLFAIDDAVERIKDGSIKRFSYDCKTASIN